MGGCHAGGGVGADWAGCPGHSATHPALGADMLEGLQEASDGAIPAPLQWTFPSIFLIFHTRELLPHPFVQGFLKECGEKESLQHILETLN